MSQTVKKGVPHKILVRNKNPGTISTGANTVVELDGKKLKYCNFIKIEAKPTKVTKVTIELYADVEFEGDVELEQHNSPETIKINGNLYTLSTLQTAGTAALVKPKSESDIVDSEQ